MSEWTEEEIATLAGMKRAKMTNKQIAARLGKTDNQVRRQLAKIKAYRNLDHKRGQVTKNGAIMARVTGITALEELSDM